MHLLKANGGSLKIIESDCKSCDDPLIFLSADAVRYRIIQRL